MTETVTLSVPSHPKHLYLIRSVLYPFAIGAGFPKQEARRIVLAVDEACSNIIKYAYRGSADKRIDVLLSADSDGITVQLKDTGEKPDLSTIAPRKLEDVRPGGLGMHFIKAAFDSVDYDTSGKHGTVLTLRRTKPKDALVRS